MLFYQVLKFWNLIYKDEVIVPADDTYATASTLLMLGLQTEAS